VVVVEPSAKMSWREDGVRRRDNDDRYTAANNGNDKRPPQGKTQAETYLTIKRGGYWGKGGRMKDDEQRKRYDDGSGGERQRTRRWGCHGWQGGGGE
jgi:hypothetical protein